MKNYNVLFIVSTFRRCGPTNQLFNMIKYLDKGEFSTSILTLSPEPNDSRKKDFESLNISLYTLNLGKLQALWQSGSALKKMVTKIKPDLIHSQGIRPDLLSVKHLKNYTLVATIRNYPFIDYPMKYGSVMGKIMAYCHVKAMKKIHSPITVSQANCQMLAKHNIQVKCIQNGVDDELFSPSTMDEKEKLRNRLGIAANKTVFISVGSFITRKDPGNLISGFLTTTGSDHSILLLLGDGPLLAGLKEQYAAYENIIFKGSRTDVLSYLKASDYFISAAHSEGLPNTVIEALACGLPVCLSDIQPHLEILNFQPQAGVFFKTGDVEDMSLKMAQLINKEQYKDRQEAALFIVKNHLSARNMTLQYMQLYHKILNDKNLP